MILQKYEIGNYKLILSKESVDNSRPGGQKLKQFNVRIIKNGELVKATYFSNKRDMEATSRLVIKLLQEVNDEN